MYTDHQFNLFPFQRPVGKIPISAARIQEAKEALIKGESKTAIHVLRDLNDKLENFERSISYKRNDEDSNS